MHTGRGWEGEGEWRERGREGGGRRATQTLTVTFDTLTRLDNIFGSALVGLRLLFLVPHFPGVIHLETPVELLTTRLQQLHIWQNEMETSGNCQQVEITAITTNKQN